MISDYPLKPKYKFEDAVFILIDFHIEPVTIASYRVRVSNPSGDGNTAVQETFYKFDGHGELEVEEARVFASENAVLFYLKGGGFNRAIESGTGGSAIFVGGYNNLRTARSFGNWIDFAGWDLSGARFRIENEKTWELITGTVSIANGSYVLNGTGTLFLSELGSGTVGSGVGQRFRVGGVTELSVNYTGVQSNTLINCSSVHSGSTYTNATIEKLVLENFKDTNELSGTVSIALGATAMVGTTGGSGTRFLTELQVGDQITIDGTETLIVATITDNNHLTVTTPSADDWSGSVLTITTGGEVAFTTEINSEKVLVFDHTDLTNTYLPNALKDIDDFREAVKSYDADYTIWTNGEPIGRP